MLQEGDGRRVAGVARNIHSYANAVIECGIATNVLLEMSILVRSPQRGHRLRCRIEQTGNIDMAVFFEAQKSAFKLARIALVVCTIVFFCAPAGVASHCMTHAVFAEEDVLLGEGCSGKALKNGPLSDGPQKKKHSNDGDCLGRGSQC